MFKRRSSHKRPNDLSAVLRNVQLWNATPIVSRIDPVNGICTVCVDNGSQLFAIGTSHGEIRIYDDQFKETILVTPKGTAVQLLQFARPKELFKLLCIDSKNTLHVWNLDSYGIPPIQASQPLDGAVYRISTSLSHSHVLIATQSGDVVTYDLAKLRLSPYQIPYCLHTHNSSPVHRAAIDVVILQHKLNHVLIGYEDGAVIYDLVSQNVLKTYSRVSVPTEDALSSLTTLALHPLEQHFAAGYEDGTIRIWSLLSSESPIWAGFASRRPNIDQPASIAPREPVFKLEWSIIEEGNKPSRSCLTILGGLRMPMSDTGSDHSGISVLNFEIAGFPNAEPAVEIVPDLSFYPIALPAQDFAVIPAKSKPASPRGHSLGRLVVISGDGDQKFSVDAFQFPPPEPPSVPSEEDKTVELEFSAELEESEERSRNLAATLDDLKTELFEEDEEEGFDAVPSRASLPFPLLSGTASVLAAELISLDKAEYLRLVRRPNDGSSEVNRYRILITRHADTSVRFHDVSAFADGSVDLSLHPQSLPHLSFRVLEIPEIALRPRRGEINIQAVKTTMVLESAVLLSTGEVVVFGLGVWKRTQDVLDEEIIDLGDARNQGDEAFSPRFMLRALNGGADVFCLSDIGFLAVAFRHGLLVIVDMRGPKVILRDAQAATSKHGEANVATSLCWTVSGLGEDSTPAPRLLALRQDGTLITHTLIRSDGTWAVDKTRTTREVYHSLNAPIVSLVLDAQTGADCHANPASLARVMELESTTRRAPSKGEPGHPFCFWVAANRREIRVALNITGDRVSKVNFSAQEALDHVMLVSSNGSSVLVAFTRGQGVAYSLPFLEAVYTFKLPVATQATSLLSSTRAGDLLQAYGSSGAGTTILFTSLIRHPGSSASGNVNFRVNNYVKSTSSTATAKAHGPEASSQTWGSSIADWAGWIKSLAEEATVTGEDIDFMLAGPEVSKIPQASQRPAAVTSPSPSNPKGKESAGGTASMANWGQGVYQQLTAAAAERGERLGQLEEHFQSLEAGSKDMVAQAKKMAEKQAAKRWFS